MPSLETWVGPVLDPRGLLVIVKCDSITALSGQHGPARAQPGTLYIRRRSAVTLASFPSFFPRTTTKSFPEPYGLLAS